MALGRRAQPAAATRRRRARSAHVHAHAHAHTQARSGGGLDRLILKHSSLASEGVVDVAAVVGDVKLALWSHVQELYSAFDLYIQT